MELYAEDFVSRRFLNRLLKQQTIQVSKGKKKPKTQKKSLEEKWIVMTATVALF